MGTFIIPGELSHLLEISGYLNDEVCGILVHQRIDAREIELSGIRLEDGAHKTFTLNSLVEVTAERLDERDQLTYTAWLHYILSDPRVHYLATRFHLNSPFNNAAIIERVLVNSILIIRKTNPSRLVCSSTPHSLGAWIFAKCFEYLNIPVFILESTPIAVRCWIYRGLDTQDVVLQEDKAKEDLTESSRRLLAEQRNCKPGSKDRDGFYISRLYMNSVGGSNSNNWWSYKRELSWLFSGKIISLPLRLLSLSLKRHLYRSYCDVAINELPKSPFVVFFMHYQPERSSLPEGRIYVQQWIAIRLLSWALPEGWTLLVREHPATWLQPLNISVRTKNLYREIASLRNTKIFSMDVDTFELIDKCKAVATLTGSVGFQSLLRGRPVIAFGLAGYKDHPACFSVTSFSDLLNALDAIQEDSLVDQFSEAAMEEYLLWIEKNSISADPRETDWIAARLKNFTEMYKHLLCGGLKLR